MTSVVLSALYVFILALLPALLEIQIEGRDGWAKNLPAWRLHPRSRLARWYARAMSGKELTGYHAILFIFIFLVSLFPYAWGAPLRVSDILKTLSLFFLFVVLWDFLWFVLNPHYPLKKFHKDHIPWHAQWFWRAPVDYYYGILLSFSIALLGAVFVEGDIILWWLRHLIFFAIATGVVVLFTIYVLNIDNWKRGG